MKKIDKVRGFMEVERSLPDYEEVAKRLRHFREFEKSLEDEQAQEQAARCMDCGVPFCQGDTGCPVDNLIPEFNELVYRGLWEEALHNLHSTNNFPEFTGRLCPAPCETACVLGITDPPVNIKALERAIIDHGFRKSWVKPRPPRKRRATSVAIAGSGPAGLACAQQLARSGHHVQVLEREDRLGGLLRYGIPDFKMEKWHIDRRIEQMEQEGVIFQCNTELGKDISVQELLAKFDALVLAIGAEEPLKLSIPGHDLKGLHYAMQYLVQANRMAAGERITEPVHAKAKNVVVIGGGDTGSDCIGTANRQGAKRIINFRRSVCPPKQRPESQPWPLHPDIYYVSSSHEEGAERHFAIRPLEFLGNEKGEVKQIKVCQTRREHDVFLDIPNSEILWDADLVLLAMGYKGPAATPLLEELSGLGVEMGAHNKNIKAAFGTQGNAFQTSLEGVYTCGDARRGQSLIVWAISEGRKCAAQVHSYLQAKL